MNTINFSVAANVVLRIIAAHFRILAALLWNLAPGNHSGTYFKMGIIFTRKAPGIKSSEIASSASSAILT